MVRICIQMLRMSLEGLEFAFECFESCLNGLNLHSNASNLFQRIQVCIRLVRIPLECLEFAFECFKSLLNG